MSGPDTGCTVRAGYIVMWRIVKYVFTGITDIARNVCNA